MADKRDYICAKPFTSFEIDDTSNFLCCAAWLTNHLPKKSNIKESWNSKEANDIRESILDGSYRYCDSVKCPLLHQIETFGDIGEIRPLYHRNNIPSLLQSQISDYKKNKLNPTTIQFSFDRTCNLECPSCRVKLITAGSKKIKEVESTIQDIESTYGNSAQVLYITGTGDPFISVGFRNFLRNFDKTKWPNLHSIHLHTNATKWNEVMWESMKNIHPYVKSCEISIDAGTKNTYENYTRIGGKWDELIENLKFISTIPNLKKIKTSFVVQKHNYKEMKLFYDLMLSIFKTKVDIYFGKILNWGTFTDEEFQEHDVSNPTHNEYSDFIHEVNRTLPSKYSWSNLQEFIQPTKSII